MREMTTTGEHRYRESWLDDAASTLTGPDMGLFPPLPPFRVTCGFPSRLALAVGAKRRIGECWAGINAADGVAQVHVSPVLADPPDVLATLVHELLHVECGTKAGHKGPFVKAMRRVGLEGKPTATVAGAALQERLYALAAKLGPYPHAALLPSADRKRQKGRLRLWECRCPVKVRVASDSFVATCGICSEPFVKIEKGED